MNKISNSETSNVIGDTIRAARLARRQAHAASAHLRSMKHCPTAQRIRAFASREARIANIVAAHAAAIPLSVIETPPTNPERALQFYLRRSVLCDEADRRLNKLTLKAANAQ